MKILQVDVGYWSISVGNSYEKGVLCGPLQGWLLASNLQESCPCPVSMPQSFCINWLQQEFPSLFPGASSLTAWPDNRLILLQAVRLFSGNRCPAHPSLTGHLHMSFRAPLFKSLGIPSRSCARWQGVPQADHRKCRFISRGENKNATCKNRGLSKW